jgi:hypothetical protein
LKRTAAEYSAEFFFFRWLPTKTCAKKRAGPTHDDVIASMLHLHSLLESDQNGIILKLHLLSRAVGLDNGTIALQPATGGWNPVYSVKAPNEPKSTPPDGSTQPNIKRILITNKQ